MPDTSATSRKQVPAGIRFAVNNHLILPGTVNFDVGAGKYELATSYLSENGVTNITYDPFALPEAHNQNSIQYITLHRPDTATIMNVLNVIPDEAERLYTIAFALHFSPVVIIGVYEKHKNNVIEKTRDGWQTNKPTYLYREEIMQNIEGVDSEMRGKYIVVKKKKSR